MKRLLFFLLPLCLCGCEAVPHKTVSLEQSMLITAIGIDAAEDGYRLTCFEGTDLSEGADPDPDAVFSIEGDTLTGALSNLRARSNRRPVLDYAGCIILGETLLESGAKQVLSELYDNPDFPYGVPLLMASDSAEAVLSALAEKTADLSGSIDAMLRSADRLSLAEAPTLPAFYNLLLSPNQDPYLPRLAEEDGVVFLDGTGVFRGEQLVSVLTGDAARGLGVLLGSARDYPLLLNRDTTVYLRRIKITQKENAVNLKLYGDTASSQDPAFLSDACVQKVEGWLESAVAALREAESDVLGRGRRQKVFDFSLAVTCRIKELNP